MEQKYITITEEEKNKLLSCDFLINRLESILRFFKVYCPNDQVELQKQFVEDYIAANIDKQVFYDTLKDKYLSSHRAVRFMPRTIEQGVNSLQVYYQEVN